MEAVIRPVGQPGDLGWIVQAHGETYAREYGWNGNFETMVARIVADFAESHDAAREAGWIAELDGRRAGCVLCVALDATTAQLRVLLVEPFARGHRIGGRLVDECLAFARQVGYRRMTLFTASPLAAARAIYVSRGFGVSHEEPHDSFGQSMRTLRYHLDIA